mmetsp:Transcript_4412/g.8850  ORF Transcript_4412/g.8850 Transcript_4412/m.8850 type:complete len:133 (+) Transcript_4412:58-456(+)
MSMLNAVPVLGLLAALLHGSMAAKIPRFIELEDEAVQHHPMEPTSLRNETLKGNVMLQGNEMGPITESSLHSNVDNDDCKNRDLRRRDSTSVALEEMLRLLVLACLANLACRLSTGVDTGLKHANNILHHFL